MKPELWQSRDFLALSALGRLTFMALVSNADDEGRLETDLGHIATTYMIGCSPDEIAVQLERMEERRMAVAYQRRGSRYIAVLRYTQDAPWSQRIDHPTPSDLPSPPKFKRKQGIFGENKRGGFSNKGQLELDSLANAREHSRSKGSDRTVTDRTVTDRSTSLARRTAGLCEQLRASLAQWGAKADVTDAWRLAEDRLLRIDQRPADEASQVLEWATHDDFWRPNIRSLTKFREQYDQLKGQMMRASRVPAAKSRAAVLDNAYAAIQRSEREAGR